MATEIEKLLGLFIEGGAIDIEPNEPKFDKNLTQSRGGLLITREEWEKERARLLEKPLP